jgi:hypothetical protein
MMERFRGIMPVIVEPKDEFKTLEAPAIHAALADPNPDNPIAREIARLISGYTANFAEHCQRLGYIPRDILTLTPRWPIEAIAAKLTGEAIRAELAAS